MRFDITSFVLFMTGVGIMAFQETANPSRLVVEGTTFPGSRKVAFNGSTVHQLRVHVQSVFNLSQNETIEYWSDDRNEFVSLDATNELPKHRAFLRVRIVEAAPASMPLSLPWKSFVSNVLEEGLPVASTTIRIQQASGIGKGTGLVIWDGAVVLSKCLEYSFPHLISGSTVLELGAGTGLVGLAAAALGAKSVIFTDLAYALPNLKRNIETNPQLQSAMAVEELDWTSPTAAERFQDVDVVLGADICWLEHLLEPLVSTMKSLTDRKPIPILLSHQTRSFRCDSRLMELLGRHFHVQELERHLLHPQYSSAALVIFKLERLPFRSDQERRS